MRRAARIDDNQTEIVKTFKMLGWSVLIIAQLKNCCDIMVAKNGHTIAVEIKDGKKVESRRKLTPGEADFRDEWKGHWELVESIDDVLKLNNEQVKL